MLQSVITIISYCLCSSHVLCKYKTIITLTFLCPALVILPGYIFLQFSYTEMHAHTLTPTHPHIEILTLSLLSWHSRSAAAIHQIRAPSCSLFAHLLHRNATVRRQKASFQPFQVRRTWGRVPSLLWMSPFSAWTSCHIHRQSCLVQVVDWSLCFWPFETDLKERMPCNFSTLFCKPKVQSTKEKRKENASLLKRLPKRL